MVWSPQHLILQLNAALNELNVNQCIVLVKAALCKCWSQKENLKLVCEWI